MFKQFLIFIVTISIFFFLAGCAKLPDYAKPQFYPPEDGATSDHNSFGYRQLKREDFQATSLPEEYSQFHQNIQARSCISVRPADDTVIRITSGMYGDEQVYMGSFSRISFHAVFNPGCSWWSPKVAGGKKGYVLQHEQIHFALAELGARRLNLEIKEDLDQFLAIGKNQQEVQIELMEKAKNVSRKALEEDLIHHTAFDEDTSMYHAPKVQQKWFNDVTQRLQQSESR
jgi:hypothetical protein